MERDIAFDPDGRLAYFFSSAKKNDALGWTVHKEDLKYYLSDEEMKQVLDVLAEDPGLGLSEQARYGTFDPKVHTRVWREKDDIVAQFS